ncbi:hypothetical protein [Enterococcus hermanniensis]|uniref:Uncharacterized protein n=1 Tax=Enterococcus hermanniensis TaxID=249189 RepID=A0A1L8TN46_9ENTE|nr:hypothetical protein [Enterococcus hermanniensis]OJG45578.1 hypothetical protein RV04_GL001867 [Enterococcus hermanniensis]
MLKALLVLTLLTIFTSFNLLEKVQKKQIDTQYMLWIIVQNVCLGMMLMILIFILLKGRTLI